MNMISVLISCLFRRLDSIESVLREQRQQVEYVVVVQGASPDELDLYRRQHLWCQRSDVRLIINGNTGVTLSRNAALEHAAGVVALFCDDDVTLADNVFDLLETSFCLHSDCSFLTFDVADEAGVLLKAPLSKGYHNLRTILGVGTIQIAVRLDEETRKLRFPVNLGAGARYPCCDEPVYLASFLRAGRVGRHVSKVVALHPRESSGMLLDSKEKVLSRFIAFRYIFGSAVGAVAFILFLVKNFHRLR